VYTRDTFNIPHRLVLVRDFCFYTPVGKLVKSLDLGSRVLWIRLPPGVQPINADAHHCEIEGNDLRDSWRDSICRCDEIGRRAGLKTQWTESPYRIVPCHRYIWKIKQLHWSGDQL
jgi:hypothetical protein